MIIACGVLSCVAVLLGIIILEIAVDKKKKKAEKAKKNAQSVSKTTEATPEKVETAPEKVEATTEKVEDESAPVETTITTEAVEDNEPAETPTIAEEPASEEVPTPTEALVVAEEAEDEPMAVIEPAVEPIIEDAPETPKEPEYHEEIIAEEPLVVVEHEETEELAVEEEPVVEEPVVTEESAVEEAPVIVEEPAVEEEPAIAVESASEPVVEEESVVAEEPASAPTVVADETFEVNEEISEPVEEAEDTVEDSDESEVEETEEGEVDEVASELKVVVKDGETRYIVIKYSKSFQAKLIQGSDDAKRYYSEIKNCLMSYGAKVKSRMSWKWESFRYGRKTLAKLRLRGKTLSIVLALNPEQFVDTKYRVESVADIVCYADTPSLYRVRSERGLKYTKELIAKLMADNGLTQKPDAETVDYASQYPYDTTESLIERKLIKVLTDEDAQSGEVFKPSDIRKSVKAQDVDNILQDEVAVELIEKLDGISDRTKTGIINIDTLSQNFVDGETVTLDEIKKRIKGYGKVTYIKVLARGTLDKRLTVEADDFSLQAVKMIALLGGTVVKK